MRWQSARAARTVAAGGVAAIVVAALRARSLRWGATDTELNTALPGDELVPHADLTATRAVTVDAGADDVWPWIAQLGQGRGGFYSYDVLENLVGLDIHSADRIVPEWQRIEVGDEVRFHPEVGMTAAVVEPRRALVLRGGMPGTPPYDFTWALRRARRAGRDYPARDPRALPLLALVGADARGTGRVDQPRHEPANAARHQKARRASRRRYPELRRE